ncbi:hypothetical protein [Geomicrobium sp. JCM 19039]|uniref:hypothetical protein n=1 Tax=Geomicrobium sp. JCM 19039 TaxID=1460636 RepID=UPI000A5DFB41
MADPVTLLVLFVGLASLLLFVHRQLTMKQPMLELRVFKLRIFTISSIIAAIGFLGLIGLETIIPLYLQNMRGFTAMEQGLSFYPGRSLPD